MPKLVLDDIHNLQNEQSATGKINLNSQRIEMALEKTLSRDGSSPNAMESNLDMNSNRIINLVEPVDNTEPVRKQEYDVLEATVNNVIETVEGAVEDTLAAQSAAELAQAKAEEAQLAAEAAETNAETAQGLAETAQSLAEAAQLAAEIAEGNAETAETNAETAQGLAEAAQLAAETAQGYAEAAHLAAETAEGNALISENNAHDSELAASQSAFEAAQSALAAEAAADNFDDVYLGTKSADPTEDNDGNPLVTGQLYFNNSSNSLKVYDGSTWLNYTAATGITAVVDDSNPTLGGDLDVNGFDIPGFVQDAEIADFITSSALSNLTTGATSSTDNAIARFDGTTGKVLQNSGVTIDDSDNMGGIVALSARSLNLNNPSGNTGFEIGPQSGVAGAAFIDFHTSATLQDYNVRLLATGDVGNGLGTLAVTAGSFTWGGSPLLVANDIGSTVQAYDADTLKADTSDDLTAGFTATSADQGTKSSGTFTPSFATRNVQHCTNGGAFTLGEPTGHGSLVLDITNNSSAGAITTSAFDLVTGDDFTTTNGHKFRCFITCGNIGSHLHVVAFQ
jgi:hypothetical protein